MHYHPPFTLKFCVLNLIILDLPTLCKVFMTTKELIFNKSFEICIPYLQNILMCIKIIVIIVAY